MRGRDGISMLCGKMQEVFFTFQAAESFLVLFYQSGIIYPLTQINDDKMTRSQAKRNLARQSVFTSG